MKSRVLYSKLPVDTLSMERVVDVLLRVAFRLVGLWSGCRQRAGCVDIPAILAVSRLKKKSEIRMPVSGISDR